MWKPKRSLSTVFYVEAEGTEADSRTKICLEQGSITNEIQHPLSETVQADAESNAGKAADTQIHTKAEAEESAPTKSSGEGQKAPAPKPPAAESKPPKAAEPANGGSVNNGSTEEEGTRGGRKCSRRHELFVQGAARTGSGCAVWRRSTDARLNIMISICRV